MIELKGKTYWLIGASEGLGRALASELDKAGVELVLSARNSGRLESLAADLTHGQALPMDVTEAKSVEATITKLPKIDGVIYCAGAYEPMAAKQWESENALSMVKVNFLGAMLVLGDLVPKFVQQGQGDIILIGSLAAYRGLPKAIGYGASKSALLSLAETLRHDLHGTGVLVRVINPGFIKTRLTDKNSFTMPMLMTPERAASKVLRAMKSRRFRTDFPWPFSLMIRLYHYLPDWLVYGFKSR